MTKTDRRRTADMTKQERREHRTWRQRVIAFAKAPSRPRGKVTPVSLNLRGGKEAGQKLRRRLVRGRNFEAARAMFERIHRARRERNALRAAARLRLRAEV